MAESMKIHANEIEGLEEVIVETIRKEFILRPPVEDMEELKRSPAGTVIRLEGQVQNLTEITKAEFLRVNERFEEVNERFEKIDERFERVDERLENMVTKEEFAAESERVNRRLKKLETNQVQMNNDIHSIQEIVNTLVVKIDEQNKTLLAKIDEQNSILSTKMDEQNKTLSIKIDEQEKRLSLFQKVTYVFFSVLAAMLVTILVLVIKLLI